jgi:uncharacterized membrane protein
MSGVSVKETHSSAIHHRDTENTEDAQRKIRLCAASVFSVSLW